VAHVNLLRKEYCTKVQYDAQDFWLPGQTRSGLQHYNARRAGADPKRIHRGFSSSPESRPSTQRLWGANCGGSSLEQVASRSPRRTNL